MSTDDILKKAVSDLKESTESLLRCAAYPSHVNQSSMEMNACLRALNDRIKACFTFKCSVKEITGENP